MNTKEAQEIVEAMTEQRNKIYEAMNKAQADGLITLYADLTAVCSLARCAIDALTDAISDHEEDLDAEENLDPQEDEDQEDEEDLKDEGNQDYASMNGEQLLKVVDEWKLTLVGKGMTETVKGPLNDAVDRAEVWASCHHAVVNVNNKRGDLVWQVDERRGM